MPLKFPMTVRAAKRGDGYQWAIADALIKEIGKPSKAGAHDRSQERFAECAQELRFSGFDYTTDTLRNMRDTAVAFSPARRHAGVSWSVHQLLAGDPQKLKELVKEHGHVTVNQAREAINHRKASYSKVEMEAMHKLTDDDIIAQVQERGLVDRTVELVTEKMADEADLRNPQRIINGRPILTERPTPSDIKVLIETLHEVTGRLHHPMRAAMESNRRPSSGQSEEILDRIEVVRGRMSAIEAWVRGEDLTDEVSEWLAAQS